MRRYRSSPRPSRNAIVASLVAGVSMMVGPGIDGGLLGEPLAVSGHELMLLALFGLVDSAVGLALFTLGAPGASDRGGLIGSLDAPLAGGLTVFAAVAIHIMVEARKQQRARHQPPGADQPTI